MTRSTRRFTKGRNINGPDNPSPNIQCVIGLGGGAGFFNLIRIYPTRSVGIAVMGNVTKYPIDAVARPALTH